MKSIIITIGAPHEKPWWWRHIKKEAEKCEIKYVRISIKNKKKQSDLTLFDAVLLTIRILSEINRFKPKYIFTIECGWESFIISAMQTFGFMRSAKHIILQFIMREKEKTIKSNTKYLLMRLIFSSINTAVCSSNIEVTYYTEAFKWKEGKAKFIPINSEPEYFDVASDCSEDYILTAGRTFRDYQTLIGAVAGTGYRVIIVASRWNVDCKDVPSNVSVKYDISKIELNELMRRCSFVVVPLEDKKISIGQSVFMQAMAMGKAVIVTKTAGSVDYINSFENGILGPPKNSEKLREAIKYLINNETERIRIGENAKKIASRYLPSHYFEKVKKMVIKE